MRRHLTLYISFICITVFQTRFACADELKGHIQETGGKIRINRPPTPAIEDQLKGYSCILGAAKADSASLDQGNFHIATSQSQLQTTVDLSNWNPWGTPKRRIGGYISSLQPSNYMLRTRYQSPFLHGDISDLAAVERAWRPTTKVFHINGRTVVVQVNLALCRPGNQQLAQAWDELMRELKKDNENNDMWLHWQQRVCEDIGSQSEVLSQFPGNAFMHVRITPNQAEPARAPGPLNAIATPNEALAQLITLMSKSGRLQLPPQTNVSEAHIMIHVQTLPSLMPNASNREGLPFDGAGEVSF